MDNRAYGIADIFDGFFLSVMGLMGVFSTQDNRWILVSLVVTVVGIIMVTVGFFFFRKGKVPMP